MHERIKKIRSKFFNNSNKKFSEALGENANTTSNWVSGQRSIGLDVIEKIIKNVPLLNIAWLITGEGKMTIEEEKYSLLKNQLVVSEGVLKLPELNKRLLDIIDKISNGNVSDFVSKIGLSHQVVNRCLNIDGRNGKYPQPSTDIITAIAINLTLININWLLTGKGDMLNSDAMVIDDGNSEVVEIKQLKARIKQLEDVDTNNLQTIKSIGGMNEEFEKLYFGKEQKKYTELMEKYTALLEENRELLKKEIEEGKKTLDRDVMGATSADAK